MTRCMGEILTNLKRYIGEQVSKIEQTFDEGVLDAKDTLKDLIMFRQKMSKIIKEAFCSNQTYKDCLDERIKAVVIRPEFQTAANLAHFADYQLRVGVKHYHVFYAHE